MKKFIADLKQYGSYMRYAAKASLKAEVAESYLNWLWWILDPLLFMLVYSFVSLIVFGKGEKYFPIFVFIGLNIWNFFSKSLNQSTRMVRMNRGVISKIYIPKYIIILISMLQNLFKMFVAFMLVFVMMPLYHVPLSWHIINMIPIFIVLWVVTFGFSCWLLDFGVYVADLAKVMKVFLRLVFYLSGIFYSLPKRVDEPYASILLVLNPTAFMINGMRDSLLYNELIDYRILGGWLLVGLIISATGIRRIIKNENNYVKVI